MKVHSCKLGEVLEQAYRQSDPHAYFVEIRTTYSKTPASPIAAGLDLRGHVRFTPQTDCRAFRLRRISAIFASLDRATGVFTWNERYR